MPFPCRYATGLDCVFPIWFTQYGRVFIHTCRAASVPFPSHATTRPFWQRPLKATAQRGMGAAWERHSMCELASAVQRRHVGDLPTFGFFRLPRGVPLSLLPEAYQSQTQFGYFRPTRGLSRRTRHCRGMAGARHGMCELTRHGNGMVCVN
jgi:hypothetical protein